MDLGDGERALIPFPHSKHRFDACIIPVATSNPTCATIKRLWMLQKVPYSDHNVWRILEKKRILTLHQIRVRRERIERFDSHVIIESEQ